MTLKPGRLRAPLLAATLAAATFGAAATAAIPASPVGAATAAIHPAASSAAAAPATGAPSGTSPPVPLLWKVSDEDNSIYLLGSFHLLLPGDYPLSRDVDLAFADAEKLLFEIAPE